MDKLFKNKNILFYGPGPISLNILLSDYDIVVITNNMISFFFEENKKVLQGNNAPMIVLYCNSLFYKTNSSIIKKYADQIGYFISKKNLTAIGIKKKKFHHMKKIACKGYCPLGLTRFLMELKKLKNKFKNLHIIGVNFYSGKINNVESSYQNKKYIIPQHYKYHISTGDKEKHNTLIDLNYTIKFIDNYPVTVSPILQKVIFKYLLTQTI